MNKAKINEWIIQYIPDIKEAYEKEKREIWDGDEIGPSIVLEDLLMQPVFEDLKKNSITEFVIHVFRGIEDLVLLDDSNLNLYLNGAVFENIASQNQVIKSRCVSLLKQKSLEAYVTADKEKDIKY